VDFSIPPELVLVKEAVGRFVDRELAPLEARIDHDDDIDPETMQSLRMRAHDLGFYGFNLPKEIGGGGIGPLGEVVVGMEMGRTSMPLAETIGRLPQALVHCDGEQTSWLLTPTVAATKTVCSALTEPNAGSDLGSIETAAVRDGGGWRLTGSKQFISNAETSDYILVLAVTEPKAPLRKRFTMFVVDRDDPQLHFLRRFRKMGWHGYHISAFALDQCRLSEGRVLGPVGAGFDIIMESVNSTRLYIAAKCVGAAQMLLKLACDYARSRRTFGMVLGDHQAIQFKIADMDVELEAARLLVLAAAASAEADMPEARIAAARAKLYATEMAGRGGDAARPN
jgi:acyl-CoA dehydrogenase